MVGRSDGCGQVDGKGEAIFSLPLSPSFIGLWEVRVRVGFNVSDVVLERGAGKWPSADVSVYSPAVSFCLSTGM